MVCVSLLPGHVGAFSVGLEFHCVQEDFDWVADVVAGEHLPPIVLLPFRATKSSSGPHDACVTCLH